MDASRNSLFFPIIEMALFIKLFVVIFKSLIFNIGKISQEVHLRESLINFLKVCPSHLMTLINVRQFRVSFLESFYESLTLFWLNRHFHVQNQQLFKLQKY